MTAVDQFCETVHVETVVLLTRYRTNVMKNGANTTRYSYLRKSILGQK